MCSQHSLKQLRMCVCVCDTALISPSLFHKTDCSLLGTRGLVTSHLLSFKCCLGCRAVLAKPCKNVPKCRAGSDVNETCEIPCLACKLGSRGQQRPSGEQQTAAAQSMTNVPATVVTVAPVALPFIQRWGGGGGGGVGWGGGRSASF